MYHSQPMGPNMYERGMAQYADESELVQHFRSGADAPDMHGTIKATALNALVGSLATTLRGPPGKSNCFFLDCFDLEEINYHLIVFAIGPPGPPAGP